MSLTIEDVSRDIGYNYFSPVRLNALFLSDCMNDGDTMRQVLHRDMGVQYDLMEALVDYYDNHDREALLDRIDEITGESSSVMFTVYTKKDENGNKVRTLEDGRRYGQEESNWLDLERYDQPFDYEARDDMVSFNESLVKKFNNAKVIDVLRDTLNGKREYVYFTPRTSNGDLNRLSRQLINEEEFSAPKFLKALTLFNQDLSKNLRDDEELRESYDDVAAMLLEKMPKYFEKVDYVNQFGLYKSEGYKELLKFSYMTTFTKIENFDEKEMNGYVDTVANSGHWMRAQHLVTKAILKNSGQFAGVNGHLLGLNMMKPRPEKFHGMENETMVRIANEYYDRDLERMQYLQLYLGVNDRQ